MATTATAVSTKSRPARSRLQERARCVEWLTPPVEKGKGYTSQCLYVYTDLTTSRKSESARKRERSKLASDNHVPCRPVVGVATNGGQLVRGSISRAGGRRTAKGGQRKESSRFYAQTRRRRRSLMWVRRGGKAAGVLPSGGKQAGERRSFVRSLCVRSSSTKRASEGAHELAIMIPPLRLFKRAQRRAVRRAPSPRIGSFARDLGNVEFEGRQRAQRAR